VLGHPLDEMAPVAVREASKMPLKMVEADAPPVELDKKLAIPLVTLWDCGGAMKMRRASGLIVLQCLINPHYLHTCCVYVFLYSGHLLAACIKTAKCTTLILLKRPEMRLLELIVTLPDYIKQKWKKDKK
jgi:hypothetical protein